MNSNSEIWAKKLRVLTHGLLFSGAANVAFLSTFIYFVLKDRQLEVKIQDPTIQVGQKDLSSNTSYLNSYAKLPFRELVSLLSNAELVEEGYRKRDLALGCLSQFHFFSVEKALGKNIQKRVFSFLNEEKTEELTLFPGLTDEDYAGIVRYAYTEKWPLTSQGLFSLIQKWTKPRDPSLEQAFFLTMEFHAVEVLFREEGLSKEDLLDLLSQSSWEILESFAKQQNENPNFSKEAREQFLLTYLEKKSLVAAKILIQKNFAPILKKLEDEKLLTLLELLQEKSVEGENFCKELLQSPRSDQIRRASGAKLYFFAGEAVPEDYSHEKALLRFLPQHIEEKLSLKKKPGKVLSAKEASSGTWHCIEEGENLWKIARRYKVEIEELRRINHLKNDQLRVGKKLQIPKDHSKGS